MYRLLSVLVWDVPAFQQTRAKKENNGYTMAYSTIWLTIPGEFKNNLNVRVNYNRLVSMTPHNCKIWKNLQKTSYVKTAKYVVSKDCKSSRIVVKNLKRFLKFVHDNWEAAKINKKSCTEINF